MAAAGLSASQVFWRHQPALWMVMRLLAPGQGFSWFAEIYGYFRWADDVVDAPDRDPERVRQFVAEHQPGRGDDARGLRRVILEKPELRGPIEKMWSALAWDANRPLLVEEADLDAQAARIGEAYVEGLWYCLGGDDPVPDSAMRLGTAATVVHQWRDLEIDLQLGYLNVPGSLLKGRRMVTRADVRSWGDARCGRWVAVLSRGTEAGWPWRCRLVLGLLAWRYAKKGRALSAG